MESSIAKKTIMLERQHTYKSYASMIQSLHHDNQNNNISMTYDHQNKQHDHDLIPNQLSLMPDYP